jgi:hypothetical protein
VNSADATSLAIAAVVRSIERCPQAKAARSRAIAIMRAAERDGSDPAIAEHAVVRACADAAVWAMERDPALAELVTTRDLGLYIWRSACAVVLGGANWTVELDLRDVHAN